ALRQAQGAESARPLQGQQQRLALAPTATEGNRRAAGPAARETRGPLVRIEVGDEPFRVVVKMSHDSTMTPFVVDDAVTKTVIDDKRRHRLGLGVPSAGPAGTHLQRERQRLALAA